MTALVISPDYASHYGPLAVIARSARDEGERIVVATGPTMRAAVVADGFEWHDLRLGAGSNTGVVERTAAIDRFLAATRNGPVATLRLQAQDRAADLLWQPERVAGEIARLCDDLDPDRVLVDHVSFGSTLAMYATGRPFVSVVPGHPSQLPVGRERYGVPSSWPTMITPDAAALEELRILVDDVTERFTDAWNRALGAIEPERPAVCDAFRVHGDAVLYNSPAGLQDPNREPFLPHRRHFVGPLTRREALPPEFDHWAHGDRPRVYVALGTFLSHRADVLSRLVAAMRPIGVRAAIAIGATPRDTLGDIPEDWIVEPSLPQVALLRHADLAVHHGGNNSVQESLAAGARQLVLPFSTDQFANAADLERVGAAAVAPPNSVTAQQLAGIIELQLASPRPTPVEPPATSIWRAFTSDSLV